MAVGTAGIGQLLDELRASDPLRRAEAADSVLDWMSSYSADEGAQVGRTLIELARDETAPRALEALLHALAELAENGLLGPEEISAGAELSSNGDPSVDEYLEYLHELASPPPPAG